MVKLDRTEKSILFVITLALALGAYVVGVHGAAIFNITLTNNTDLNSGLVAHWTFDGKDMVGGVLDTSGYDNTAILGNLDSTTTIPGKVGQALQFSSSTREYALSRTLPATLKSFAGGDPDFSITFWAKPASFSKKPLYAFYDQTAGYTTAYLRYTSSTTLRFCQTGAACNNIPIVEKVGEWHYITLTYDQSYYYFYEDGVFKGSVASVADISNVPGNSGNNDGFYFGASDPFTTTEKFGGALDDFRVYSKQLSVAEIGRLYDLGATTHINTTIKNASSSLESGLVGHWTFDGPDMDNGVEDTSGNGNNGHLVNFTSTTTVPGRLGQALDFDGVDDHVTIPATIGSMLNITGNLTISMWVYFKNCTPTNTRLIDRHYSNSFMLSRYNVGGVDRRFVFDVGGAGVPGGTCMDNTWTHLTTTYDATTQLGSLYQDGSLVATGTLGTLASSSQVIYLGETYASGGYYFDGNMDDLRIYSRALTPAEVTRLYDLGQTTHINTTPNNASSSLESGLVGHWTFDGPDMIGGVLDTSGQGHNGTLVNNTSTTTVPGVFGQALRLFGPGTLYDNSTYVDVPASSDFNITGDVTVSAWVRANSFGPENNIVVKGIENSEYMLFSYSGGWYFRVTQSSTNHDAYSNKDYSTGKWVFLVGRYNGSKVSLFVNGGTAAASTTLTGSLDTSNTNVRIGADYYYGYGVDGTIDDVRIYNRALSDAEIQRLYDQGQQR